MTVEKSKKVVKLVKISPVFNNLIKSGEKEKDAIDAIWEQCETLCGVNFWEDLNKDDIPLYRSEQLRFFDFLTIPCKAISCDIVFEKDFEEVLATMPWVKNNILNFPLMANGWNALRLDLSSFKLRTALAPVDLCRQYWVNNNRVSYTFEEVSNLSPVENAYFWHIVFEVGFPFLFTVPEHFFEYFCNYLNTLKKFYEQKVVTPMSVYLQSAIRITGEKGREIKTVEFYRIIDGMHPTDKNGTQPTKNKWEATDEEKRMAWIKRV